MVGHHDRSSMLLGRASNRRAASGPSSDARPPDGAAGDRAHADVLSDVLRTVRLTGALFFSLRASSPWADEIPPAAAFGSAVLPGAQHVVSYHIVVEGACWATLHDTRTRLEAGDIIVVPHGDPYVMSSAPGIRSEAPADAVVSFFREMAAGSAPAVVTEGGGGPERAELVCGFLAWDIRPFNPVLQTLPRLIHLRQSAVAGDHLGHLIDFALAESRHPRAGGKCVLLRLSEVLFVEVVRRCLEALGPEQAGWLAGLRDPIVGRALALLHNRPADSWTLERLAREIGASRSAVADRFSQLVGQPPMRYLAHWRMQLAARLLTESAGTVAAIAQEVGYDSEAAFSRGFKKTVGVAPATWRRQSRTAVAGRSEPTPQPVGNHGGRRAR